MPCLVDNVDGWYVSCCPPSGHGEPLVRQHPGDEYLQVVSGELCDSRHGGRRTVTVWSTLESIRSLSFRSVCAARLGLFGSSYLSS